jgi:predicted lysophospholipase L1 biosynthesis ABC-type transport system permease subunit
MRAFNQRLAPKEFGGVPIVAAVALLVVLAAVILALVLPGWLKIAPGGIALAGFILAVRVFRLGDDWVLRAVLKSARGERHAVTSETWTHW